MRYLLFPLLLILAVCCLNEQAVKAQSYDAAFGIHLGNPNGITYKKFIGRSNNAIEILAGVNVGSTLGNESLIRGFDLTGLYEWHLDVFGNLQAFYGVGGQAGITKGTVSLGLDSVLGIEYTFDNAPINFGFDVRAGAGLVDKQLRAPIMGGGMFFRFILN